MIMKRFWLILIGIASILLLMLYACSRPSMMPAQNSKDMPQAPGNYTSSKQDARDIIIKEQADLIKLYEKRIQELENRLRGGK